NVVLLPADIDSTIQRMCTQYSTWVNQFDTQNILSNNIFSDLTFYDNRVNLFDDAPYKGFD
ncbi:15938_t:CDS:1, partial [Racocetra fulgida]